MEKAPRNLELITAYFNDFTEEQVRQLAALEPVYQEWNAKINVISRKDIDGLYEKHVLHSLAIAAAFNFQDRHQVIDIGTGGGFPGIPLAIFFPSTQFHLVDSIGKKLKVVEAVVAAIGLKNITTQHTRAEDIRDRKFDVVVSRAVAPLKELWQWGGPLLKKSSRHSIAEDQGELADQLPGARGLICLKGGDLSQEIAESGCRPKMMELFELFPLDYFREKYLLQLV